MSTPSRRDLLRTAGCVGLAASVGAAAGVVTAPAAEAAVQHLAPTAFLPTDQHTHLLRRATYGPTPESVTALKRLGHGAWLDRQLDPTSIDDSSCDRLISSRFPELGWSMAQVQRRVTSDRVTFATKLGMAAIARATWSKRQLLEVMVDFWSNHLNVTTPANTSGWYARPDYDRVVIRRHALGRFEDMLVASAKHPAMLTYLNNADSTKDLPNENYGRELLELHTVGVDGGYDETDMYSSVLIMTGLGLDAGGGYQFDPAQHHTGPVSVMDFSDPNGSAAGGEAVAVAYLRHLANHPETALRLAEKLCLRFVDDRPVPVLAQRLADTYLANGTAIAPVLRELFTSAEFAASIGQKVRRPMEDVVATLRVLGVSPEKAGTNGMRSLYFICNQLGNAPYAWATPDGYPDTAAAWESAGASLWRWNRHLGIAGNFYPAELRVPPLRGLLPKRLPRTHGALVDVLAERLVFRRLRPEHKQVVLDFLEVRGTDPLHAADGAVNWRFPSVVALILDSPYHGIR